MPTIKTCIDTAVQTDIEVIAQLERLIVSRTNGRLDSLQIDIIEGQIILAGTASTYYAKQQAAHAALTLIDASLLDNRIEVV
ncbi:MAG: hypothetical protein R3C18_15750 [Planctomycetaceae bacterium]